MWVADGPDFAHTARQVTHYSADDGQPIASLRLTPDGKTVLYALGSELNDAQESANPASSTKGASQQVFALEVDAKGASPRLLGEMGCPEEDCEDIRDFAGWQVGFVVGEKEVVAGQRRWETAGQAAGHRARISGSTQMVARWQACRLRQ